MEWGFTEECWGIATKNAGLQCNIILHAKCNCLSRPLCIGCKHQEVKPQVKK